MQVLERDSELDVKGYVTLRQYAGEYGYKPNTLYKWLRRKGVSVQHVGGTVLVARGELDKYRQNGR